MKPVQVRPDWRDAAAYHALADVDGAGLAWEWLRRDPGYYEAWHAAGAARAAEGFLLDSGQLAPRWGLHFR